MRGDSDEVGTVRYQDPPETLDCVAKHERTSIVSERGDLGNRLNDANLIVDQHHRDECDALVQSLTQLIEV